MKIWCDGSANFQDPKEHLSASRIVTEDGYQETFMLGKHTSNYAELNAVYEALRYAVKIKLRDVEVISDSRVALRWLDVGPSDRLSADRAEEVRSLRDKILLLVSKIPNPPTLRWCPRKEQRADLKDLRKKRERH